MFSKKVIDPWLSTITYHSELKIKQFFEKKYQIFALKITPADVIWILEHR